jgi:hypothetical protein
MCFYDKAAILWRAFLVRVVGLVGDLCGFFLFLESWRSGWEPAISANILS